MRKFTLVIHGGAGGGAAEGGKVVEVDRRRSELLADSLRAGAAILCEGGTALDAVEAAVMSMEDCPAFNAGRGSVFTSEGRHEMDASIMDGSTLACGAVAGLSNTRNPIRAARYVMESTPHVFFAGEGAEVVAEEAGLPQEPSEYFGTQARWAQLQSARSAGTTTLSEDGKATGSSGTVGAVALDCHGNLAAATTTGGMTNKLPGRVGDTPVVGAGTYAKNGVCALSAVRASCPAAAMCGWPRQRPEAEAAHAQCLSTRKLSSRWGAELCVLVVCYLPP
jgi:beta-aspartyl-peptidase (threonine type)